MPEKRSCFSVFVNVNGLPEYIQFTGQETYEVFPVDETTGMSAEADWLCLLALFTALRRSKKDELSASPCLSERNKEHTKSIAEALCNKKNFNESYNAGGQEIEDSKDKRHWLVKIFGVPPRDAYLNGTRTKGAEKVMFVDSVDIKLMAQRRIKLDGGEMGIEEVVLEDEKIIESIFNTFWRYLCGLERDVSIILSCIDRSHHSSCEYLIKNNSCDKKIDQNSSFEIRIKANFKCKLAVFWMTSDRKVHLVYPYHELPKDPGHKLIENIGSVSLNLGVEKKFRVHPPRGLDHCIVLDRDDEFSENEMKDFRRLIEKSVKDQQFSVTLRGVKPRIRNLKIARNQNVLSRDSYLDVRFGIWDYDERWPIELARMLAGQAGSLHILSVPNHQP
jgi:hypothetical protein